MNLSINTLQKALALTDFDPLAAQMKMMPRPRGRRPDNKPGRPRQGGVLALLYDVDKMTHIVLTRRRDDLNSHAGQISFPGGRREDGEPLARTALREAHEEIGVNPTAVTLLGQLNTLYIPPSDYEVHPFVGWHQTRPTFVPQDREVAEILEVPLSLLLDPTTRHLEPWDIRGFKIEVPYFMVDGHKVWGATAMMLSEFLERLRTVS